MNSISSNLNIMIKAAEKASKVLIRDFGELEKLQVSSKGPSDFVTNSDKKVEKIIIEELTKTRKNFSIIGEEIGELKNSDKENNNERRKKDEIIEDFSGTELTARKNIESVIPVKRIPDGWVFRDELLAPWESNLPAVLSIIPDTTVEVVYHDDNRNSFVSSSSCSSRSMYVYFDIIR